MVAAIDERFPLGERELEAFCRRHHIRKLSLFGSALTDHFHPDSDLDFLVEFDRPTFDCYMGVKEYLEGEFGRKIDLVMGDSVKPRLRTRILDTAVDVPGL